MNGESWRPTLYRSGFFANESRRSFAIHSSMLYSSGTRDFTSTFAEATQETGISDKVWRPVTTRDIFEIKVCDVRGAFQSIRSYS